MKSQTSTVKPHSAPAPLLPAEGLPAVLQANGSPNRTTKPRVAKGGKTKIYAIGGIVVLAACGLAIYALTAGPKSRRPDLILYKVHYEPLNLTVVERGALESADNREVTCRVKAGSKATALNIKWVIDDGAQVKAGDVLMEIDDSPLQDALKVEKIALDQANAAWVASEEQYKITISQNVSDIKTQEVGLQLARIDLKNFLEGAYPADLKTKEGAIRTAESDVEQQRDRAAWSQRMVKKGYQTVSQAQAEQAKLESLQIALE